MHLKELENEYNQLESPRVDFDYLKDQYVTKVKPYLAFIKTIRYEDGRPNEDKVRRVLGVTKSVWLTLKQLPTFRELLDLEGDYMKFEVRKKVVDLLNKEEPSAKDVELGLKVFDDEYGNKKVNASSLPDRIRVDLFDARMEDAEIIDKAKLTEE
jgi:hypothetical protein